jgi:hypothetical protein
MAEIDDLRKQLEDLNKQIKEAGGLGIDFDEAIKRAGNDVKVLQTYVAQLNKQYEDLVNNADYVYRTFQDISAELKNQNLLLKIGKSSFKGFADIAQDLNSYQKGYNDLTDIKFKKLKNNLSLEKNELEFVVARLKAGEKSRIAEAKNLSDALIKNKLEGKQKILAEDRLKELQKENELLINAEGALKSGIFILEKELDLTKQIANTRKDLGGISQAAGKLISQYGGSLASFLNVNEAIESVEEYNKQIVQGALNSKEVRDELLKNEAERLRIQKALDDETIKSSSGRQKAQDSIKKLEEESYAIKQKAIASTDTLANKNESLGVLIKGLGEGFKKSLNDPLVKFTIGLKAVKSGFGDIKKAFNIFLEYDKIFVDTARNLGLSEEKISGIVVQAKAADTAIRGINGQTFDTIYTSAQLAKSFAEVNNQLGLSVDIGAKNLNEFTAMTNQMGLSADEATKLYKIGVLNNMSLEDTNKAIVSGVVATQKQTGVQVNTRQVLQEIGKLSAGITTKFQQNPAALAQAVTQAKALGTSLEQVDKVGESLLNFESSIENELKAELITGKQLNLEKARYAALTGDQATLTAELANQVGSLADFQGMNVIAQKSLAEAFGLSRDEVADMLTKQETFNKLGDVSKKSAAEQLALAKERGLSETDSLVVNLKQQAASEKIASAFDNFKSAAADILIGLRPLLDIFVELSKHTALVYSTLVLIGTASLAKTIGGLVLMASQLGFISLAKAAGSASDALSATAMATQAKASNKIMQTEAIITGEKVAGATADGASAITMGTQSTLAGTIAKKESIITAEKIAQAAAAAIANPFVAVAGLVAAAAAVTFIANAALSKPKMAKGGVVMPTPGGTDVIVGEANSPEAIIPLNSPKAGEMLGINNSSLGSSLELSPMIKAIDKVKNSIDKTIIAVKNNNLEVSPNINIVNQPINPNIDTNPIPNPNTNFESTIKPNIAPSLDLTPFINVFNNFKNDVINAMNKTQPTPQFALHVDGKQLGTVVGKQMETGTSQNIYTGYKIA